MLSKKLQLPYVRMRKLISFNLLKKILPLSKRVLRLLYNIGFVTPLYNTKITKRMLALIGFIVYITQFNRFEEAYIANWLFRKG